MSNNKLTQSNSDTMNKSMQHINNITVALLLLVVSHTAQAGVETTTGKYFEINSDLSIKVLTGQFEWQREWRNNHWYFNRFLVDLTIELDSSDGVTVKRISRDIDDYTRVDSAGTVFKYTQWYTIAKTPTGFRWNDRTGRWIEYNSNGKALKYGDRNNNSITVLRDAANNQRIVGFQQDQPTPFQFLTVEYHPGSDLVSLVKDYTDRQVSYTYVDDNIQVVTDVRGYPWTYSYNGTSIASIKDPNDYTRTLTYSKGRVATIIDKDGHTTNYDFDYLSSQKLYYQRIQSPSGKVAEAWYQRDGDIQRRDLNGITILTVVEDGRNEIHTDMQGRRTTYLFDEFENPAGVIYADGSKTKEIYDPVYSNLQMRVNERGFVTEYTYLGGLLASMVEAKGTPVERTTTYTYFSSGLLESTTRLADAVTEESSMHYVYDSYGNLVSFTDGEGSTTQLTLYDVIGNNKIRIDPRSNNWLRDYDAEGNSLSQTDPLLQVTQYQYDPAGNLTKETFADSIFTLYAYDGMRRLLSKTDYLGGVYRYEYNASGNTIKTIDESMKELLAEYDSFDRLAKSIDGNGNEMQYNYPSPGDLTAGNYSQLQSIVYPNYSQEQQYDTRNRSITQIERYTEEGQDYALETTSNYDSVGNVISIRDAKSRTRTYDYDALNRLIKETDASNNETTYSYDNRDNRLTVTDANQNTHAFSYYLNNTVKTETRPMGETQQFFYDSNNNIDYKLDAIGQKTQYSYDSANRQTTVSYSTAADLNNPVKQLIFTYNNRNKLTGYDDQTTQASYDFDELQRKISESVNYGDFSMSYSYSYYANGQKQSYTAADGSVFTYSYTANRNIESVSLPGEGVITYANYQLNDPRTITYPGGAIRQLSYDPLQRIKTIQVTNSNNLSLMNYEYTYDELGNITQKQTEKGLYSYGYDTLNRLIDAINPTMANESYIYDPLGNRLTAQDTGAQLWQYNENNELLDSVSQSYIYNDSGSTISSTSQSEQRSFSYNTEERLTSIQDENDQTIASYYYDPLGRRLWKDIAGIKTYFQYSDEGLSAERNDAGDLMIYHFQPDSLWSTDPVFRKQGDIYYYYQTDHLGTPQKLIDKQGQVVYQRDMDAFGQVVESGAITDNLMFPGQYRDVESGGYYNYFRDYDSGTGRYVKSDPIGLDGGLNAYLYVGASPQKYKDPLGLCKCIADPNGFYEPGGGQRNWLGREVWTVTCVYTCTDSEGNASQVTGSRIVTFWFEDGSELSCFGVVYLYNQLNGNFQIDRARQFDPKDSDVPELLNWAKVKCIDCGE